MDDFEFLGTLNYGSLLLVGYFELWINFKLWIFVGLVGTYRQICTHTHTHTSINTLIIYLVNTIQPVFCISISQNCLDVFYTKTVLY